MSTFRYLVVLLRKFVFNTIVVIMGLKLASLLLANWLLTW